jgi:putative PIN family toxin of toxin-antitoxin system
VKIVFDTNIYISAFIIPNSKAETAIMKVVEGKDTLIISKAIINETLTVLSTKFYRDKEALSHLAVYMSEIAQIVEPYGAKLTVLKDEPDNRILECALSGKADAIVTGDKEMLKLKEFEGIRIISLREYLDEKWHV